MLCPWVSLVNVTYKAIIWDKMVKERKTISAMFLGAHWCLSRAGSILWIMQAGEVGRAEGKSKGKYCSTAVDLRETSASERNLEKSPQAHRVLWAVSHTHLCLGRLRAKHCSGSRGMGCVLLPSNSQKSQEELYTETTVRHIMLRKDLTASWRKTIGGTKGDRIRCHLCNTPGISSWQERLSSITNKRRKDVAILGHF